jgi:hypothetical protein
LYLDLSSPSSSEGFVYELGGTHAPCTYLELLYLLVGLLPFISIERLSLCLLTDFSFKFALSHRRIATPACFKFLHT